MGFFVRLADDLGEPPGAIQKSFFRNTVAFAVALAAFAAERRRRAQSGSAPRGAAFSARIAALLVLRSVAGTLGIFGNFYAISHMKLGDAMMLNKLAPFFTVLFAALFLKEKMAPAKWLCVAGAVAGAGLVAKPSADIASSGAALAGLGGGLAAGAAYACVRALGRAGTPGTTIVLFFSGFSTLAAVPFMAAGFVPMTAAQTAALCGAGAAAAIGQFGVTYAYRFAAPRDIALLDYSNVFFAAMLGWTFFGQTPDVLSWAGYGAIFLSAAAMSRIRG